MSIPLRVLALTGLVAALVVGAGCAGSGKEDQAASADTGMTGAPSSPVDSETGDMDTAVTPEPVWWALDGVLAVSLGEIDLANSNLTVTLAASDVSTVCATTRVLVSAELLDGTADELHGLWNLTLAEGEGCTDPIPVEFEVGFGPYSQQLDPALDPTGLDGDTLFGLYMRIGGEPLYVFGVAGTADQFAGTAAVAPPLADGVYTLNGLHVLPL